MLTHLSIRQFAVVEALELEFKAGMTVLTGETGAGKSILIDALQLALGERADSTVIRQGATQAEISAIFDLEKLPKSTLWLKEHSLDAEDECIIRRILTADGRSRAFINGKSVTLSQVRELGEQLLDIHGQHQHQSLLKPEHQRRLLDEFGNHPELIEQVRRDFLQLQHLRKEYQELLELQGQPDKLALLHYQSEELQALNLMDNELISLETEHKELAHAVEWMHSCDKALVSLNNGDAVDALTAIYLALNHIAHLKTNTSKLNDCHRTLQSAAILCEEAVAELMQFRDKLAVDPERLNTIEQRLSQIHALARKYRTQPELLIEMTKQLEKDIGILQNLQVHLEHIKEQINLAETQYKTSAHALSMKRQKTAKKLEIQIIQTLKTLEMPHAEFNIQFTTKKYDSMSLHGIDELEFLVSTNPGLSLQPLRKIASGGELSRISLAIQVITSEKMTIPTLIFDEVDAGISGKTAETVGKLLKTLASDTQVLCVTHLPQIAAMGHHHYKVEKQQTKESTTTIIYSLEREQRVHELARMLGGSLITQHALMHAKEMLEPV